MKLYNLFLSFLIPIIFIGEVSSESYKKNSLIKNITISQNNNINPKPKFIYSDQEPSEEEWAVIYDRAKAVGAVAGINCGAKKNNDQRDLNDIYIEVFNKLEINYLIEWINRPLAIEAIRIMGEYFDEECKISNEMQKEVESRIYPYLFDLSKKDSSVYEILNKLRIEADIALEKKDFLLSEKKQLKALKIAQKNNLNKDTIARIYISLFKINEEKKEPLIALEYLKKAEKTFEKKVNFISPLKLYVLIYKTDALINLDRYTEGLQNAQKTIKLIDNMVNRFPGNKEFEDILIYALWNTTYHYMNSGNIEMTDNFATRGIETISKYKSPLDLQIAELIGYQMLVRTINFVLISPEQINKYKKLAGRNLSLRTKLQGKSHVDTLSARRNLSDIFIRSGEFKKGIDLMVENVSLSSEKFGKNSKQTIYARQRLSFLYSSRQNYRKALPLSIDNYNSTQKVYGKKSEEFITSTINLASIYERLNQLLKAKKYGEEAYEISKKLYGDNEAAKKLYWTLFTIYKGLNDEKLLAKLEANLPQDQSDFDPNTITLEELIFVARGAFKKPINERIIIFEKKLEASKRLYGTESLEVANLNYFLGTDHFINKNLDIASKYFKESLRIRKIYSSNENNLKFLNSFLYLAKINILKGDIEKARDLLIASDKIERDFINYNSQNLDSGSRTKMIEGLWRNKEILYNFSISTKGNKDLILLNLLNSKGILADLEYKQGLILKANESTQKKSLRLREIIKQSSNLKLPEKERKNLLREKSNLEISLYSDLPLLKPNTFNIQQVSNQLENDSVLIEFVKLFKRDLYTHISNEFHDRGYEYYAVILYPNSKIEIIRIGNAFEIESLINESLIASEEQKPEAYKLYLELSKTIIDPIIFKTEGFKNWYLSPDGEINRIPFSALTHNRANKYLSEAINIRLLTSGRELLKLKSKTALPKNKSLVVSNPSFNLKLKNSSQSISNFNQQDGLSLQRSTDLNFFDWNDLPGTAKEGKFISEITNAKLLTLNKASVSEIEKHPAPLIAHIASHSYYLPNKKLEKSKIESIDNINISENPLLRSGIVLAGANNSKVKNIDDGFLTALEVTKLDWEGTELVVISGCESGKGDIKSGEGVYGLKRAIAVAGAKSSMLSLWKVNDTATASFMKSFYLKLRQGKGKGEALSLTQKEFRNHPIPGFRHPYVWAAFQLSGDWKSINW